MTITADEFNIAPPPTTNWTVARSHYANAVKDYGKDSPQARRLYTEYWCVKLCATIAETMNAHDMTAEQTHRIALTVFQNGRRLDERGSAAHSDD